MDPITIGIIATAAASALAGGASAAANYRAAKKANKQNKQIADESNELTYRLFREGNLFNHDEAQLAFDREFDAAKYTTQKQQMLDAGLNPAVMFGEGNINSPANSSAASSLGVPSMVTPTMQPAMLDFSAVADLANAFKSIAEARKAGAETNSIEKMLSEQVRDMQLRIEYQEILNQYEGKKSANQIAKMLQDIEKGYVEIDNLIKEGKLTEAQTRLTQVQEEIGQEEKGLKKADREIREALSEVRAEYTQNILDQQEAEQKKTIQEGNAAEAQGEAAKQNAATNAAVGASQIKANEAAADLSHAQKKVQESINELNKLDIRNKKSWSYKLRQFNENLHAAMRENLYTEQQKYELGIIRQRLKMAIKANDTYMISLLTGQVSAIMGAAAATAKAAK